MKTRLFVLLVSGVGVIAVVFASSSLGSGKAEGPTPKRHALVKGSVMASATKSSGLKVRYQSDEGTVPPNGNDGFEFKCPKKFPIAISGFGGALDAASEGKVSLMDSYPRSQRIWAVGMRNLTDQPQKYFVGIICAR